MERFTAYCDPAFLQRFYDAKPEDEPGASEAVDVWADVNRFLLRDANVVVNAPNDVDAFVGRYEVLFRKLFEQRPEGTDFRLDDGAFEGVEAPAHHEAANSPWRVYLLGDTVEPHAALSNKLGVLFVDAEGALAAWARLGRPHSIGAGSTSPKAFRSWKDLAGLWTPAASLIVCDRFLFSRPDWAPRYAAARDTILPLLLGLLHEGPNEIPASVLLIAREGDAGDFDDDPAEARAWLLDHIARERPQLNLDLAVALLDKDGDRACRLHDRRILMSYGLVTAQDSLSAYVRNGKARVGKLLRFHPVLGSDALAEVAADLRDLAAVIRRVSGGEPDHPLLRV